jgi:hypothetical protein
MVATSTGALSFLVIAFQRIDLPRFLRKTFQCCKTGKILRGLDLKGTEKEFIIIGFLMFLI